MADTTTTTADQQVRLPIIRSEDDIAALSHLSEEEKELARGNLEKIPHNPAWQLLGNDPAVQGLWHMMEVATQALLQPDVQFAPGSPMNLISLETARYYGCEWQSAVMTIVSSNNAQTWKDQEFSSAQLGMLAFPDSAVWTAEQRLTLKFTRACLENRMTDELVAQARAAWGDKRFFRHLLWLIYCQAWGMIITTANLRFEPGQVPSAMPQERVQHIRPYQTRTWEKLLEVWRSQPAYGAV